MQITFNKPIKYRDEIISPLDDKNLNFETKKNEYTGRFSFIILNT
jgi:hypothetical protein